MQTTGQKPAHNDKMEAGLIVMTSSDHTVANHGGPALWTFGMET